MNWWRSAAARPSSRRCAARPSAATASPRAMAWGPCAPPLAGSRSGSARRCPRRRRCGKSSGTASRWSSRTPTRCAPIPPASTCIRRALHCGACAQRSAAFDPRGEDFPAAAGQADCAGSRPRSERRATGTSWSSRPCRPSCRPRPWTTPTARALLRSASQAQARSIKRAVAAVSSRRYARLVLRIAGWSMEDAAGGDGQRRRNRRRAARAGRRPALPGCTLVQPAEPAQAAPGAHTREAVALCPGPARAIAAAPRGRRLHRSAGRAPGHARRTERRVGCAGAPDRCRRGRRRGQGRRGMVQRGRAGTGLARGATVERAAIAVRARGRSTSRVSGRCSS